MPAIRKPSGSTEASAGLEAEREMRECGIGPRAERERM
jgi:hypothetical protein